MENVVLLSTTSEKPKIRKNEIQYFIVQHFPFFRQKLSVVLNCTPRSEKSLREAAVEPPQARSLEIQNGYIRISELGTVSIRRARKGYRKAKTLSLSFFIEW